MKRYEKEMNTLSEQEAIQQRLCQLIRNHSLPATPYGLNFIATVDEYINAAGVFCSDAVVLRTDVEEIREWLGY